MKHDLYISQWVRKMEIVSWEGDTMRIRAMDPVYVPVSKTEKDAITRRIEAKHKGFLFGTDGNEGATAQIERYGQVSILPKPPTTPTYPTAPVDELARGNEAASMMNIEETILSIRRDWGIE